jgi:hypothetical protein
MKTIKTIAHIISLVVLSLCYYSCTPTHYVVDTTPYVDQINSNPSEVVAKPEHVTPVGGFKLEAGAILRTDKGDINISDSGVSGDVVIDLRNAPGSALRGGK